MDDSKQNLYASTTSETPTPLKGRPAGTGHRTTSKAELPTSTVTAHGGALLIRDASGANGHGGPTEPAASEPGPVEQPDTRPAWRKALSAFLAARWVLAIPAFIIAIYAAQLIEQARIRMQSDPQVTPPLLSWQLFAVAGALLMLATFPSKAMLPAGPSQFIRSLKSMKRRGLFLALIVSSLVAAAAALPLFWILNGISNPSAIADLRNNFPVNTLSWILYIAALVLFALAFVVWERNSTPPVEGTDANTPLDKLPRMLEWAIMLGVFGLALYLRMSNLDNVPPGLWFDEAQNGVVGRDLVGPNGAHLTFLQDFTQMGALYFYFDGLMVKFFGNQVWVVRFLPALAGSLCAPMLYLLASRLYGWRVGLAAAGFLAVSSWNITFSRFGMASMPTVALDVAVFLCIAQALRTGRLGYYAGAGVLLGLCLQMYYISRLVPIILVVLLVHRLITQHIKLVRSLRAGLVVFAVGALIAFMPVGLFWLEQPAAYNGRPDTVSIFNPANNGGNLQAALTDNTQKHMLMFNWRGDSNGRHNLPGSPMLDWITAALFFAGLCACALRFWRWQYIFPIAWFIATVSGGILTLPFEAPQSHRALEGSVVTALLAGIFIGEVWTLLAGAEMASRLARLFRAVRGRMSRGDKVRVVRPPALAGPIRAAWVLSAATLLIVLWLAGTLDYHKYFEVQARDMGVWKDMYAPQAHAARVSIRYGPDHDVYMAPILKGLPPSVYLAPDIQTIDWPGMQALPLSTGKSGGVVIILDLPSAADVAYIARIYPHASFELYTAPSSPEVLIYTITIPAGDIHALEGARVTTPGGGNDTRTGGGPAVDKNVPKFTNDSAVLGIKSGTVRLATTLRVDNLGKYSVGWANGAGETGEGQIMVDGTSITSGQPMTMGVGLHSVVVTSTVQSSTNADSLVWSVSGSTQAPIPDNNIFDPAKIEPHGLTANFIPGINGVGEPTVSRIDPVISFNFHETPLPRPYTGIWTGKIYIPEDGQYTFGTEQLSTSNLYFDGQEIIANNSVNVLAEHQLNLTTGFHSIKLVYTDQDNYSHMYLYWTPPGRPHSIIPSAFLWPEMGEYPTKPLSGKWPTLDESDGTQVPQSQITYFPPRDASQQAAAGGSAPPPLDQNPPPVPDVKGKTMEPLALIGNVDTALGKPRTVAVDKQGNIYIFTEVGSKINKFDSGGKFIKDWSVKGTDGQPVIEASSLIIKDGKLMLLDSNTSDMLMFGLDGSDAGRMHLCLCFFARGVSLSRDGNIWVANTGGGQILKVSPTGQTISTVGDLGTEPGKFTEPASVAEAPDGTLYVADIGNKRVQSFTPDYKPLAQWDMGPSVARDGNRVAVDSAGNVLVTEAESKAVVQYDKQGKELGRWFLNYNGQAPAPSGIASLGDNKYIVLFQDINLATIFSIK